MSNAGVRTCNKLACRIRAKQATHRLTSRRRRCEFADKKKVWPGHTRGNFKAVNPWKRGYNPTMAAEPEITRVAGMVPDALKNEPRSKGITTPRKKKPKELAVITECCTGCAGSPACVEYCPVEDCMFWVPDEDHPPFGRIQIDPILCIGCKKCLSKGPDGCFLDGCPWDAIVMVDIAEVEKVVGAMSF
jgi:ferredoxin